MPVPFVSISKVDFQTGSVGPSPVGVLAIIASAASGPQNAPSAYTVDSQAFTDYGPSPLVEESSYTLAVSGNPVIPIRPLTSTAAAYGAVTRTMTGTSVPSAGAAVPADNYNVLVTFVTGGTIGVTGIQFTYSLDGGNTVSAVQNLGTSSTLTIPNFNQGGSPGVSFAMAAGTVLAGDFFTCPVTAAQMTDADLATALESLRVSTLPWEGVLVDEAVGTGTISVVDTWLTSLEKVGKFRFAALNTRFKNQATPESETAFATAMATLVAGSAPSIRLILGTDGGKVTSTLTGLTLPRPASLATAADAMAIPIGQDPAFVGAGPISGFVITDGKGNPAFHNEELYPNLDQLLLTTLRSVNGQRGVYITNARVFSTVGSDYVFLPHIRTMNRGCEIAYQLLTTQLGKGVRKKPKDPQTGGVYILEADAAAIEAFINEGLSLPLKGQVNDFKFSLSRTDDLSANSGATVNATLSIVALAYIKGFKVIAAFAKSISVTP
jgi:hypothetical protein